MKQFSLILAGISLTCTFLAAVPPVNDCNNPNCECTEQKNCGCLTKDADESPAKKCKCPPKEHACCSLDSVK